jgi:tRNA (mo5U34)-methyltransferase
MAGLDKQVADLGPWYHSIDLGDGVVTPGKGDPKGKFNRLAAHLPEDLSRFRVLDLGCNAGGVSVEFAKRGATVVGVEAGERYYRQASWIAEHLGLSAFTPLRRSIYQIGDLGKFDVVVFLGLVYHLRYPQLALDLLASVTDGWLFLSTPKITSEHPLLECRLPSALDTVVPQSAEPAYNWWFPTEAALRRMMTVAGFTEIEVVGGTERPFVSSDPGTDNTSAFPTGQLELKAHGHGNGSLPELRAPRAKRRWLSK